jgi:hypothetical protein
MVLYVRDHRLAIVSRVDVMDLGKEWCGVLALHHHRNVFQLGSRIDSILMHFVVYGVYLRAFQWLIFMLQERSVTITIKLRFYG